ncbi:hypothetical protein B0T17DRAFT_511812 [Bombardia bombarda]|uniref:Uncharacterized protein n=1 Tax=Bombardia bombarda TaxID=252184 RepID=A0AA39TIF2_9PEZI|nr:hypothetical protein B0T17DRAFT_511812 [Bombardia bombarda]
MPPVYSLPSPRIPQHSPGTNPADHELCHHRCFDWLTPHGSSPFAPGSPHGAPSEASSASASANPAADEDGEPDPRPRPRLGRPPKHEGVIAQEIRKEQQREAQRAHRRRRRVEVEALEVLAMDLQEQVEMYEQSAIIMQNHIESLEAVIQAAGLSLPRSRRAGEDQGSQAGTEGSALAGV